MRENLSEWQVVKVEFYFAPAPWKQRIFYFGSLAAIYELFTPAQVGLTLHSLWRSHIDLDRPKLTKTCRVSKVIVYRKKQNDN